MMVKVGCGMCEPWRRRGMRSTVEVGEAAVVVVVVTLAAWLAVSGGGSEMRCVVTGSLTSRPAGRDDGGVPGACASGRSCPTRISSSFRVIETVLETFLSTAANRNTTTLAP